MAAENGNGTNGGPWWLTAIRTLGWQVALILALVWFIAKDVRESQAATLAALQAQSISITEMRASIAELRTSNAASLAEQQGMRRILGVICAGTVKNAQPGACIQ